VALECAARWCQSIRHPLERKGKCRVGWAPAFSGSFRFVDLGGLETGAKSRCLKQRIFIRQRTQPDPKVGTLSAERRIWIFPKMPVTGQQEQELIINLTKKSNSLYGCNKPNVSLTSCIVSFAIMLHALAPWLRTSRTYGSSSISAFAFS
jgi:hypothetical protein